MNRKNTGMILYLEDFRIRLVFTDKCGCSEKEIIFNVDVLKNGSKNTCSDIMDELSGRDIDLKDVAWAKCLSSLSSSIVKKIDLNSRIKSSKKIKRKIEYEFLNSVDINLYDYVYRFDVLEDSSILVEAVEDEYMVFFERLCNEMKIKKREFYNMTSLLNLYIVKTDNEEVSQNSMSVENSADCGEETVCENIKNSEGSLRNGRYENSEKYFRVNDTVIYIKYSLGNPEMSFVLNEDDDAGILSKDIEIYDISSESLCSFICGSSMRKTLGKIDLLKKTYNYEVTRKLKILICLSVLCFSVLMIKGITDIRNMENELENMKIIEIEKEYMVGRETDSGENNDKAKNDVKIDLKNIVDVVSLSDDFYIKSMVLTGSGMDIYGTSDSIEGIRSILNLNSMKNSYLKKIKSQEREDSTDEDGKKGENGEHSAVYSFEITK